jgi:hypothetical protein
MLPFIYDMGAQILQLAERRDVNTPMIIMQAVNMQLRKFLEKRPQALTESTLYASVVDLLSNLSFPMPGQQPQQPVMQGNVNVPQGQFISPGMPPQMQQMPPQMAPVNQMQPQVPPQMGGPMNPMG